MELLTQELEWGQDNMSKNKQDFNLNKEDFQFVQMNEKIFDKKFETKAVGYFGDALRRFCKNKSSLVAFILLMIIILMAIFVPMFSKYDATTINISEQYLPPRIPILEKLGIADGTKKITGINVDYIIVSMILSWILLWMIHRIQIRKKISKITISLNILLSLIHI